MKFLQPICRAAFVGGVVAITILSLLPTDTLPMPSGWDKLAHFGAYGGLALIGAYGFTGPRTYWAILTGLIALGGLLEIGQHFVGRFASVADGIANGIGALAGIAAHRGSVYLKQFRGRSNIRP